MGFKTELHCHDRLVSACGRISPEETVERCLAAGYTTLVITDHLSRATFDTANYGGGEDWQKKIDFYMRSYKALKEVAGDRLHILLGCEIRINSHAAADFLVYGMTEEFLRTHNELHGYHFRELSNAVREAGMLFVQAHPFRDQMVVVNPEHLDGVEVFNASVKHGRFRCEMAKKWAEHYGLIQTSGSDIHHVTTEICGGIETDEPITSNEQLLEVLRSGNYRLLERLDLLTQD